MTEFKAKCKLNNKGSAIVTVLIVIIFISIMATTVLYLAGRNVKMKATDRHTKESFYETEKSMEEIKAGLIRIASESYEEAYAEVLKSYAEYDATARKNIFVTTFMDACEAKLAVDVDSKIDVAKFVTDAHASVNKALYDGSKKVNGVIKLTGVTVTDTMNDYTTVIRTDFAIVAPTDIEFNVGFDTSVPDSPEDVKTFNASDCVIYVNWEKR
ncbi:MAG: hypothetical protein IKX99_01435 [Lachnospiraceae bacterium]|nr:hypothetical protein [Lachnospiraceae bacterium]MBR5993925.1 hypothetical protein [Lachnospiraceae bacterium]